MLIIYNTCGQNIKSIPIQTSSISNTILDATKRANGIYYLGVDDFANAKSIKLIKIR